MRHPYRHSVALELDWLRDQVTLLPEDGANKSRDAGRGYAQAVTDVLHLIDTRIKQLNDSNGSDADVFAWAQRKIIEGMDAR